jgi:ornithine carbamoyltransferase
VRRFADAATIPVVNALTGQHHPCQSVADLFTLQERFGELRGLPVAYLGDGHNNVTHSLIEGAALTGMHLTVASPEGHRPDADVLLIANEIARETGASIVVTADVEAAVTGASAVYTDTWFSMGADDTDRTGRGTALEPYRVDASLLARAARDAIFMHCLPAYRGNEVAAEVIDGPQSVVFDQAENRMHTEQAILVALLGRRLMGRAGTGEHGVFAAER